MSRVDPIGGTAIYDAIAKALPMAEAGRHKKKAVLVISDGNDTNSSISVARLGQQIRDSEVLVYALGVDGAVRESGGGRPRTSRDRSPHKVPPCGRDSRRTPYRSEQEIDGSVEIESPLAPNR